eukprot:728862-Ditylum_brightwellii.AAC.1
MVGTIESTLEKDNEDMQLICHVLEYDKMLYNIMSKRKKQHCGKSVQNIDTDNNKKQQGNNNSKCTTYITRAVGAESFVPGMPRAGRNKANLCPQSPVAPEDSFPDRD